MYTERNMFVLTGQFKPQCSQAEYYGIIIWTILQVIISFDPIIHLHVPFQSLKIGKCKYKFMFHVITIPQVKDNK